MRTSYLWFELLRTVRNRRLLVFSLAFPLGLFLLVAVPNRHARLGGIPFATYYMAGMASWGAMVAVISAGARIAAERQIGWVRQLRITPLSTRRYFTAKIISGYLFAAMTIVVLYVAGAIVGVRLSPLHWLEMTGLMIVGLVPFTVIGIMLGHLLKVDSMGPALGGISSFFAVFGGAWGPIVTGGALLKIVKALPSYWLVQAGRTAVGGQPWPSEAWVVIIIWTAVFARLAKIVYRRDTQRV